MKFTLLSNSEPHSSGSHNLRAWHKCLSGFEFRKAPCSLWLKSENELSQATWWVFPMLELSDPIQRLVFHSKLAISPKTNKSARENVNLYQRIRIRWPDSAVSRYSHIHFHKHLISKMRLCLRYISKASGFPRWESAFCRSCHSTLITQKYLRIVFWNKAPIPLPDTFTVWRFDPEVRLCLEIYLQRYDWIILPSCSLG